MFVCVCSQNPRTHGWGSPPEPKTARRRRVYVRIHAVRSPFALTHSLTHVYTTITYNNVRVKIRPFVYRTITLGVVGVPSREPRTVRVDPDVWSAFTEQVVEWEGQKHGEIGRHVENALSEYIDHGREARIESKIDEVLAHVSDSTDSHTHTANATPSTMTERVEAVGRAIAQMDRTVVRDQDVESEIKEYVRDDRSIRKYKRELKDMGLAYEHPGDSSVWTTDREQWVEWAEGHVDNVPDAHVRDLIDAYPITFDEYDKLTTTVTA